MRRKIMSGIFTKEEIDLAINFSTIYKEFGEHQKLVSDNNTYVIEPVVADEYGYELRTIIRVGHDLTSDGEILIQYQYKLGLSNEYFNNADFIFFIMLWAIATHKHKDIEEGDKDAISYYVTTGRKLSGMYNGVLEMVEHAPSELNTRRVEYMETILTEHKNKMNA